MILSTYGSRPGGYLNFGEVAEDWLRAKYHDQLPAVSDLNDPVTAGRVLEGVHHAFGWDWSYGGYLENRDPAWRGSYLSKTDAFIHLGVDFNAPIGTPVMTDRVIRIIDVGDDSPLRGGWGVHVLGELMDLSHVANPPVYLLFAHLDYDPVCKRDDVLVPGAVFARIGAYGSNGWWYPHVHVQALSAAGYNLYLTNPRDFDGYGKKEDIAQLVKLFPDPLRYIKLT
jgi:murein DD-endopeptidase MepM/ murein hydrolase activator NlpD